MEETQKFRLANGNEITVSELGQGEYAEKAIMIMLEEAEKESMALVVSKEDAWAVGRALMRLGYTNKEKER